MKIKISLTLIALVAMSMSVTGFAQEEATDMRQLRQQAMRVTILGELPEEARADADVLLDQGGALAERAQALRAEGLQAYIDAVEAGEAPVVARALAQQSVSEGRLDLARDMASFRDDVQAFADEYPEARGLLGRLRQGMGRGGFGPGGFGSGGMGRGDFGPGGMGRGGFGGGHPRGLEQHQGRMGGHQQGMNHQQGRRGMHRFNNMHFNNMNFNNTNNDSN